MYLKLIPIASYTYTSEAMIYKAKLQSEGIQVYLQNEHTINTDPLLSNAVGGVQLLVSQDEVMVAKKILNDIPSFIVDNDGNLLNCKKCHQSKIVSYTNILDKKTFLGFIPVFIFGGLPWYAKHKYYCENCKTAF
jgi:hypothetical protein